MELNKNEQELFQIFFRLNMLQSNSCFKQALSVELYRPSYVDVFKGRQL